jgi:hypothetical protein
MEEGRPIQKFRHEGESYLAEYESMSPFVSLVHQNSQGNADCGWKVHISLQQTESNIENAWNVIIDLLIEAEISQAKVLHSDAIRLGANQVGKQITIYLDDTHDWSHILHSIEDRLESANVQPGPNGKAEGDKEVAGSQYFSYRNDKGIDGHYITATEAIREALSGNGDAYNIANEPDLLEDVQINLEEWRQSQRAFSMR